MAKPVDYVMTQGVLQLGMASSHIVQLFAKASELREMSSFHVFEPKESYTSIRDGDVSTLGKTDRTEKGLD